MLEFGISYGAFGSAILGCLPPEGDSWVVPPKSDDDGVWKGREDLRDLTICSIDPPGLLDATLFPRH
jgi:exosome complex exonuclease DIS3/RRP44